MKHGVSGISFYRSCLCCGLVIRIHFCCCEDMLVDAGVWVVMVFAHVAYPTVPAEERELSLLRKVHTGSGDTPSPPASYSVGTWFLSWG